MYHPAWYSWVVLSNFVLRMAWMHRLIGNLSSRMTVTMLITLLEVFRRYQWVYVRVETELRKIRGARSLHGHHITIPPSALLVARGQPAHSADL